MEAERDLQALQRIPERLVVVVVPRLAIDDIGAQKDRLEPEVFHDAVRFLDGVVDVVHGDHAGAEHAPRDPTGRGRGASRCRPARWRRQSGDPKPERRRPSRRARSALDWETSPRRRDPRGPWPRAGPHRPAARGVIPVKGLVPLVVTARPRRSPDDSAVTLLFRECDAEVPNVLGDRATGRDGPEFRGNVALPQVRAAP